MTVYVLYVFIFSVKAERSFRPLCYLNFYTLTTQTRLPTNEK